MNALKICINHNYKKLGIAPTDTLNIYYKIQLCYSLYMNLAIYSWMHKHLLTTVL